jgi:hypothetical protein
VWSRLRALLPSWRFFDRVTAPPALLIRIAAPDGELGAWHPAAFAREPVALRWLIAPRHNLALAYHAVVERLVLELGELDLAETDEAVDQRSGLIERDPAVTGLVSYQLVARIAAEAARGASHQWKITVGGDDYLVAAVVPA